MGPPARPDRVEIRAAGNALGDVFGTHELRRTGETGRRGELGIDRPTASEPAELVMCAPDRGVAIGIPADRELPDHPSALGPAGGLAGYVPTVDKVFVRLHRNEVIGEFGESFDALFAGNRHADADRHVRYVPQPRRAHLKVIDAPVHQAAAAQRTE